MNYLPATDTIKTHTLIYLQEVLEAFSIYMVYALITNRGIDLLKAFKISFLVGLITYLAENYKPEFKQNIKTGMTVSIGSGMFKNMSNTM